MDKVSFYPYFVYKDLLGFLAILVGLFTFYVFFLPNYLGHPDNYIENALLLIDFYIVSKSIVISFFVYINAYFNKYSKFRSRYRTAIQSMYKQFWSDILALSFYKWRCKLVGKIQTKLYLRRFIFMPDTFGYEARGSCSLRASMLNYGFVFYRNNCFRQQYLLPNYNRRVFCSLRTSKGDCKNIESLTQSCVSRLK